MLRVFSLTIFLPVSILSQPNFWKQSNGPNGGFVSAFGTHSTKIFVGTYGGLFSSSDNGSTWKHVGPFGRTISDIVSTGSFLFASARPGGVYRSSDEGETWTNTSAGLPSYWVTNLAFRDSFVLAAFEYYGVYRSSDYGQTWLRSDSGIDNRSVRNLFTSGPAIIASSAGGSGSGMFRTTDNGHSWTRLDPYPYAWNAELMWQYSNTLYGVDFENNATVRLSTDNGLTWFLPAGATAPDDIIYALYADNTGLYVGTYLDGIFRSPNGVGNSWSAVNNGISNKIITSLGGASGRLYAGSFGGVFVSSNSGSDWSIINNGLTNSVVMALFSIGDTLFAGTWGAGVFISVDLGKTWQPSPSSPDSYILDLFNIDGKLIAIVDAYSYSLYNGGPMKASTDRGATWSPWGTTIPWFARSLAANSNFAFANTESGIYRSDLNGNSWTKVLDGYFPLRRSIATSGSIVIVGGYATPLKRSTDNGNTWADINIPDPLATVANIGGVLFGGRDQVNVMYRSKDSGSTWQKLSVPLANADIKQITGMNSFVVAGLSNDAGVIMSFDSGTTWQRYNFGLLNTNVQSLHLHQGVLHAGTWGNGVFTAEVAQTTILTDSLVVPPQGATNLPTTVELAWSTVIGASYYQLQVSGSSNFDSLIVDARSVIQPLSSVSRLNHSTVYYWRVRGETLYGYQWPWVTSSFKTAPPDRFLLHQNYPNPFNTQTRIVFDLDSPSFVTVRIYNILGQLTYTLFRGFLQDGTHAFDWVASQSASGVYFYTIETGRSFQAKKMLLIR